jgi:hypothetical protein
VSITAPQQDVTLEDLTRDAWQRYAEAVRDLTGEAYARAEPDAWDVLQDELADIAALDEQF